MSKSRSGASVPDTILVDRGPGETRAALLAGDEVVEIVHRRDGDIQSGAVYAGRVGAGVPGVAAVFVDIGAASAGVMAVKGRAPAQGSAVAVVVVVPPRGDKGAEIKSFDAKIPEGMKVPGLLNAAPDPAVLWWDCYRDGITRVLAASPREAMRLKGLLGADAPVDVAGRDFFDVVEEATEAALNPHVSLPSGGSLIIEHTAAVTAIDVNSGAGDPGTANTEAVVAVARELRRRNIAGHIVVDLIPSKRRTPLARQMAEAVSPDLVSTNVAGITPLGMVEITRRRLGLSLTETLCDQGGALSATTVAYKALRDAVRLAHSAKAAGIAISAAPEVVAEIEGPLQAGLLEAKDAIKGDVSLTPRADFARARVDVHPA